MYDNIRLDKAMYNITGKSFTQALTELDPDEGYKDTELRGLDAFERQLKRFGIKVSGADSDRVEKFFVTAQSAVLFPEYVRRMIKKGIEQTCISDVVCGAVSKTDGVDYRGFSVTSTAIVTVDEGDDLPETTVKLSSSAKSLKKFSKLLSCSYESVRRQRLEAFGIMLKEIGAQVGRGINSYMCLELALGVTPSSISGQTITYADLAAFWSSMSAHDMDVMVCHPAVMAQILALPEMKFCVSDYMKNGRIKTPYGVTLVKCAQIGTSKILGVDSTVAAELVLGSDVMVDTDRLITNQMNEVSCSVLLGVSKVIPDAVAVLTV
ncbi:hypothetical protein [Ruminococcus albus]|uniref:Phage capsid family n=1 Tax=Ruminococcus albus 8 TaxID=246199 RepID=E9SH77_RUMAL|nr:hypothetical protein [Ruminococcus albus]EGC01399.1 hypothetical protein CUS_7605 [Ruminococcus albus 8]MCC3351060.1 hypothetical protein [Ruminococcus albus 8]